MTFIGTITLARILAPSDYGVYGIIAFVVSLWSAFGDFGLGAALVQQHSKPTAAQLRTVWTAQQCIALAAVVVIWLIAPLIAGAIPGLPPGTEWMLRALSLGLLMSSLRTLPAVMMERELRFGPLATAEILQMTTFYVVAVAMAVAGGGAWAFVVAGVSQLAVGALVVNLAWRKMPTLGIDRDCLKSLFGFGFAYQVSVIVVTLRDAPLPALVGLVSGTVAAGLLQFSLRIALTIAGIDAMIARIAFPAFSRLQGNPQQQARALDAAILMTGLVVIPAQCWIAALAPVLVPLVFGPQWSGAILPLQIICIGTLLRFPARYLRQAEFADGKTRRALSMSVALTLLALVAFVVGLVGWGLTGAAVGFLVGAALGLGASIWLAEDFLRLSWRRFWLTVGAGIGSGAVAVLTLSAAGSSLGLAASLAAGPPVARAIAAMLATAAFGVVCLGLLFLTNRAMLAMGVRLGLRAIGRRP
jgi:PST family polysaccharide transporter